MMTAVIALLSPIPALSQHNHGSSQDSSQGAPAMEMETRDVLVDNIKVSFAVMDNAAHRKMLKEMKMKEDIKAGTTHNITVVLTDQDTQQEITDAKVSMRVVKPGGQDEVKALKYEEMMKSYDAYFNMPEKGKYEILVLFRFDGQKKTAGTYYDL
jgi:hypothetical protein